MMIGRYLNLRNRRSLALIFIILIALLFRLYFLFQSDNVYGVIPAQKIMIAEITTWDMFDSVNEASAFLYPYLLKVWMGVFNDIYISPRILSLLFGLLTLIPFFFTVKIIKDGFAAMVATFLLGVFPLHIIWSTLSMEEAPFYFIIFSALYLFLKYKFKLPKKKYLFASALLITCAYGFRFESALYSIVLTLFLLKDRDKRNILIFFILSSIMPVFWMVVCWVKYHSPFASFIVQSLYARLEVRDGYSLGFILGQIKTQFTVPLLLLGIWGYIVSIRDKKMHIMNIIFTLLLCVFIAKISLKALLWQERYLFLFGLFFLIYISLGFASLLKYFNDNYRKAFVPAFCLYCLVFSVSYFNRIYLTQDFSLSPETKNIINYFSNIKGQKRILLDVDKDHVYSENIAVYSGLDLKNIEISDELEVYGNVLGGYLPGPVNYAERYKDYLMKRIANAPYNYIIYSPEGRSLRWIFPLESEEEYIGNTKYKRCFTGDAYWIYKLEI